MKNEMLFIQYAVGMRYLSSNSLLQFFQEYNDIPNDIDEILLERQLLTRPQVEAIWQRIHSASQEELTILAQSAGELVVPMADGSSLEIAIPDMDAPSIRELLAVQDSIEVAAPREDETSTNTVQLRQINNSAIIADEKFEKSDTIQITNSQEEPMLVDEDDAEFEKSDTIQIASMQAEPILVDEDDAEFEKSDTIQIASMQAEPMLVGEDDAEFEKSNTIEIDKLQDAPILVNDNGLDKLDTIQIQGTGESPIFVEAKDDPESQLMEKIQRYQKDYPEVSKDIYLGQRAVERGIMTLAQLESCLEEYVQLAKKGKSSHLRSIFAERGILNEGEIESLGNETTTFHSRSKDAEETPVQVGEMFLHYKIKRELGRGGMGIVYKAMDTKLHREVALKLILPGQRGQRQMRRFVQETRATAQIQHPNIVRLYEVGDSPKHYFTMEYVSGRTMEYLAKRGKIELRNLVDVVRKVADALFNAHQKGIVHRDIKPANVMVAKNGEPKIMDFGLAKISADVNLSNPGELIGTPAYMPPEQAQGTEIDHRTDIYSLGATLYEGLTGRPPFQGATYEKVLHQIFNDEPLAPREMNPDIPVELEAICLKCLEKNPARRYENAAKLAGDLQNFLDNKPISARPLTKFSRLQKFLFRHKVPVAVILLFIFMCMGGVAFYIRDISLAQKDTEEQRKLAVSALHEQEKLSQIAEHEKERAIKLAKVASDRLEEVEEQRQKAKDSAAAAQREKEYAEQQRLLAVEKSKLAQEKQADAERLRKLAEKERAEKQREARIARIRLARISMAKADEAYQRKQWREYGVLMGTALEFLKGIAGEDVESLRAKGEQAVTKALLDYGLVWRTSSAAHHDVITCALYSPDGRLLATGGEDGAHIWDAISGKLLYTLEGHKGRVRAVAFSPGGSLIASAGQDNTVRLWASDSGRLVHTLEGHTQAVYCVAFNYDGTILASAGLDRTIHLWNTTTGSGIAQLNGHSDGVTAVAFSPREQLLASSSRDHSVRLWDIAQKKQKARFTGHTRAVNSIAFHSSGKLLVSAGAGGTIRLWSVDREKSLKAMQNSSSSGINHIVFVSSKTLAAACDDASIGLWNIAKAKQTAQFLGHSREIYHIDVSPNSKRLISTSRDHTVRLWDISTKRQITHFTGHTDAIGTLTFHPDGKTLASGAKDNTIRFWDADTGREQRVLKGHRSSVNFVIFSGDGKYLASASDDKDIILWQADTGNLITRFSGHRDHVNWLSFSHDSQYLASASDDKTVRIWKVASRQEILQFAAHDIRVNSVSFGYNDRLIASAADDRTVKIWNVGTKKQVATFTGRFALFHPEGRELAAGSHNPEVGIWDVLRRRRRNVLRGHESVITSLSFSADGKYLASSCGGSAARDNSIRVWDAATGKSIAVWFDHDEGVEAVALHPTGKSIASSSGRTIKLWQLSSDNFTQEKPLPSWAEGIVGQQKSKSFLEGGLSWFTVALREYPQLATEKFFQLRVTETLSVQEGEGTRLWE